jgi:hypothetical protein
MPAVSKLARAADPTPTANTPPQPGRRGCRLPVSGGSGGSPPDEEPLSVCPNASPGQEAVGAADDCAALPEYGYAALAAYGLSDRASAPG